MHPSSPSQHRRDRFVHRALILFVLLTCLRVWVGPWPVLQTAQAQIPDAGMQRKQVLEEARKTNQLLSEIIQILQRETLKVRLEGADNQAGPLKPARRP